MTSNVILRLGKDAHLVQYPLRSGSILNLVATIRSESPTGGDNHPNREKEEGANHSALERAFSGWSREARLLTKAPVQWHAWPLYTVLPFLHFHAGAWRSSATRLTQWCHSLHRVPLKPSRTRASLGRLFAQVTRYSRCPLNVLA